MIGIGCAIFFLATYSVGLVPPVVRFFDAWIPAIVILFQLIFIRSYRPKTEAFHFWEGLMIGNMMCWLGGLISGILIWAISEYYPIPFQHFIDSAVKYLQISESNLEEHLQMKNLDEVIREIKKTDPSFMIWDELKKKVIYSFILVPIISMIIRRK